MDSRIIKKALEELTSLHYIRGSGAIYSFTYAGNNYTLKKSGDSWLKIAYYGSLWLRENPRHRDSWKFIPFPVITEEQFNDFCEYYNIKIGKTKQLVICDEVEFMDI